MALFKVSRETFSYICSIVRNHIMSQHTIFMFLDGYEMSLNDQVAVALRRLSSIESTTVVAEFFGTDEGTVGDVIWLFVVALGLQRANHLSWPSDMARTISGFQKFGNLINCCGAIETINLKVYPYFPNDDGHIAWLDRNSNESILLQAIVDPNMRFLNIVTGVPGNMTRDTLLKRSDVFKMVQSKVILNGQEIELNEETSVREYLVGGSGFQLLPWLMTPYHDEKLTQDQSEFNKRHLATRLVARQALNKLKSVWGVIDGGKWMPGRDRIPKYILACCILHNIMIDDHMEGDSVSDESMMSSGTDLRYRLEKSALPDDEEAMKMRDNLCLYLNGKLPA